MPGRVRTPRSPCGGDHAQFSPKEPQGVWVGMGRVGLMGEVVPTLGPGGPGRPAVPSRPLMP